MKKKDDWLRGYCCCLAIMIKMEGGVQADHREAFAGGIGQASKKDLLKAGVELEDIEVFEQYNLLEK